jgi:orotidine-5'-phosphate decarboxylase
MEAAKEGAARGAREAGLPEPRVIAVTVLTSLGDAEVRDELGLPERAEEAALRLAGLAQRAGLDGVVCAVHEVQEIKRRCGKDFLTVTPGIRPAGADPGDQTRVATPRQARAAGSDYLVVGRPVTRAADPVRAAAAIVADLT